VERAGTRARSREQRFAGLLAVAADWYWEMDASFRFTHLSEHARGARAWKPRAGSAGALEIDNFGLDAAAMDAHRADLESHQPFIDLLLHRIGADGRPHWYIVSGRPRFDTRGVFIGYWGAGRDVTTEKQAELARMATEARYRELFARSPSPLVLHRNTHVLDANDAALALLGVADIEVLIGRNLLDFYDEADGSHALAAERGRLLHGQAVGESMPAHQFTLRTARGRRIVAQVTSVKIDTGGGAAILSIYHDETERLRAEASRVRSEALMDAPGRDQPGPDHADRPGDRALRDDQRRLHARQRLGPRRGHRQDGAGPRRLARQRGAPALRAGRQRVRRGAGSRRAVPRPRWARAVLDGVGGTLLARGP
jgi:PAS domain S-box-containing protein